MVLLQRNANILPIRMFPGVLVVSDIARLGRKDAVVPSEFAVFAGEPRRASLSEDDVSWDHVFA